MADDHREMSYYTVPAWLLNKWLVEIFTKWVSTPGGRELCAMSQDEMLLPIGLESGELLPHGE